MSKHAKTTTTRLSTPISTHPPSPTKRRKLTGRKFYESLGSPKMVLAPMVDQSEFVCFSFVSFVSLDTDTVFQAWRMLTRSFMEPEASKDLLTYTPMMHSRLFVEVPKFRDQKFQATRTGLAGPSQSQPEIFAKHVYLDGHPELDRPLFVQFCANSPEQLLEAARYVEPYCDAVDLNLGCPQNIARKGNYGAFLQDDWDLIYRLINKLHQNLEVPVTAKIRILETKERTLEYAKMILSAGASIITVHGRHRDQKGHKTGLADWSVLRYLRKNLPPDTVIFANGNILQRNDIYECLKETGADGVMSAEANLHDPTIFAKPPEIGNEGREYWRGKNGKGGYRMDAVFRRYMDILHKYVLEKPSPERKPLFIPSDPPTTDEPPATSEEQTCNQNAAPPPKKTPKRDRQPKTTSPNILSMQAHLFHLLRFLVSKHTNIRDALARSRAGDIAAYENVLRMVEAAVKEGLLDYESNPSKYDDDPGYPTTTNTEKKQDEENAGKKDDDESSVAAVKACKRPWWVCQPYVRPLPKEALVKGSLTMSKKDKRMLELEREDEGTKRPRVMLSEREKVDEEHGLEREEMPKESMVCG